MSANTNPHMDQWKVIELMQYCLTHFSLPPLSPAYSSSPLAGWFLLVSLIPSSVCMLVRRKSDSFSWK